MSKANKMTLIGAIINALIFILVLIGWILMLVGYGEGQLASLGLGSLRYFTVLSNLYMGLIALILAIYGLLSLIKKKSLLPSWTMALALSGTSSVSITFLVVVFFLAPLSATQGGSYFDMFQGPNLILHLFAPILSIVNYLIFLHQTPLKRGFAFISVLPVLAYGIFYIANFYAHWTDSLGNYDWYSFLGDGAPWRVILLIVLFIIGSYALGLLLWFLNTLIGKKLAK